MDWIMIIPNGVGAILGFIQIFICLVIPRQEKVPPSEIETGGVQPAENVTDVDVETTSDSTNFNSQYLEEFSNEGVHPK